MLANHHLQYSTPLYVSLSLFSLAAHDQYYILYVCDYCNMANGGDNSGKPLAIGSIDNKVPNGRATDCGSRLAVRVILLENNRTSVFIVALYQYPRTRRFTAQDPCSAPIVVTMSQSTQDQGADFRRPVCICRTFVRARQ
jgi:hypothetical protein